MLKCEVCNKIVESPKKIFLCSTLGPQWSIQCESNSPEHNRRGGYDFSYDRYLKEKDWLKHLSGKNWFCRWPFLQAVKRIENSLKK